MKKIFQFFFSVTKENNHKIWTILGIKFKFRNNKVRKDTLVDSINLLKEEIKETKVALKSQISREIWLASKVSSIHTNSFLQYKNINTGKDIVIMASGPTVKNFVPIKNAIYIAVNRTFKYKKVKFDYLFMEDYHAVRDYIEDAKDYECVKFYGITNHSAIKQYEPTPIEDWLIPESISIEHKANRFYSEAPWLDNGVMPYIPFAHNLLAEPLYSYGSIMFPAIQFALWTNPRKIYIVGWDNTPAGYFDGSKQTQGIASDYIREYVLKLKEFVINYYPKTEIISINPIGLKGIFRDEYTENHIT